MIVATPAGAGDVIASSGGLKHEIMMAAMGFEPEIVIMSPDTPRTLMVVGVKSGLGDPAITASQLKAYMASMSCPTGLLVTPDRFQVYRHTYSGHGTDAVRKVAEVPTAHILDISPAHSHGLEFERFVQRWLEQLQARAARIPADVQQVIEENILPALDSGVIRAARPRWPRIAS